MPCGVVGEHLRMNEQKQFEKRKKRAGPKVEQDQSIQARFERFHEANPHVYSELVRLARKVKSRGVKKYSVAALYEVLRYNSMIQTDGEPFKLCDSYRSRYARLIMEQEPDLFEFFRTKQLRSL